MTTASVAILAHRMAQLAGVGQSVNLLEDRLAPSNAQAHCLVDRIRASHRLDIRPPRPDFSDTAKAVRRPFYDALVDLAATWGRDRTRLRDLKQRRKILEREIERLEAALNKGSTSMTVNFDFDTATVESTSRAELVKRSIFELNRLDALARSMERKWGVNRLPLLVGDDLSDRFFAQYRKTSIALRSPDPKQAIDEIARMINAWRRLDTEAENLGAPTLKPFVMEAITKDGAVIAIVRDFDEAGVVQADGREVRVYAASEIARLIEAMPTIASIKETFPGARVKETRFDTPDHFWEHGDEVPF